MVDVIGALREFLLAESAVTTLVGTRVYGEEILKTDVAAMPRHAVVISLAGGGLIGAGYQDYGDTRIDVDCYGKDAFQANTLYLAVYAALKHLRREVAGDDNVLLHSAQPSSKGIAARDPETDWPLVTSSWQVFHSEVAAA